jgi:hypothetical protein
MRFPARITREGEFEGERASDQSGHDQESIEAAHAPFPAATGRESTNR